MSTALLAASLVFNALVLWSLARERGRAERLERTVQRMMRDLYGKPKLPPPPTRAFALVRPLGWGDSRLVTQVKGEERLSVDFSHRRW